jgi:TnsA endonuclease N terminal
MGKFAQGRFDMKNPAKYVGKKTPLARSSWEFIFMRMLDEHPGVEKWASESIQIPYRCPITGKYTIYVPDFFVVYNDKKGSKHAEVVEVKPQSQTVLEKVGKSRYNQEQYVKNMAKWEAANAWCKQQGLKFRIVNEGEIFHQGAKRK